MKKKVKIILTLLGITFTNLAYSQIVKINKKAEVKLFKEVPTLDPVEETIKDTTVVVKSESFKPSIQVGAIVHMFGSYQQNGFGLFGNRVTSVDNDPDGWSKDFSLYRARVLVAGRLSKNGSFFIETDLPTPIGKGFGTTKNVKVAPIIADAQYEHRFGKHSVIAGLQLVSHSRNGLQAAVSLMANDYGFFQYPYNIFAENALQGNFGRDLGVNSRGFFLDDKLEYRFGIFTGRNTGEFVNDDPALRYVGRVAYNLFDVEQDYYYAGTKLGRGKTLAFGAGFDAQGTYQNFGADVFLDMPAGKAGSVTANAAFSYITGGTDTEGTSFATLIPRQTTQFLEVGYYFTKSKLQPWIRYENKNVNADGLVQTGGLEVDDYNDFNSVTVLGGGLNYWFAGYNTNIRLSYTTWKQEDLLGESQTQGQIWLQTQFFVF